MSAKRKPTAHHQPQGAEVVKPTSQESLVHTEHTPSLEMLQPRVFSRVAIRHRAKEVELE